MNGGEISGNTSSGDNGSVISVSQYGTFTMSGGKISSNTSSGTGGRVVVVSEGAFTMQDGEISGNTGRGVSFNSNETFTMKNGKISGNIGGGVFVRGTFMMENGEISGNSLSASGSGNYSSQAYFWSGGGVYVGGTFVMQNGKISDNTVSFSVSSFSYNGPNSFGELYFHGGGVYVSGTFTMEDGDISDNTTSLRINNSSYYNARFYTYGGGVGATTFNMNGGKISGNNNTVANNTTAGTYMRGSGVSATTFNMNGGEISGNIGGTGVDAENFRIANGIIYGSNEVDTSLMNPGALTVSSSSWSNHQYGTFSGSAGSTWNSNGNIYSTTHTVKVVNGVPYIGNSLANNYTFNTATTADWDNACSAISIYDGISYTINVTADFNVAGRTTANFGGASGITVTLQGSGRTLTLSSGGNIIRIGNNQTVILKDLTLRGLSSNNNRVVYVNGGTFNMSGGEISGNYGGGVYVDGTFNMSGGEISGNTADYGGGVYVFTGGNFTKTGGGTITGYASDTENGNVVKNNSDVVQNDRGHAVFVRGSPEKRRETTAGPSVNLDSSVSGAAGGWES